jgi:hypothetical protein
VPVRPDLGDCESCGAPVTEFAARAPLHPEGVVGMPVHDRAMSRWAGAEHRFGPIGKLAVTAIVLLMGPWGSVSFFTLLYAPAWVMLATIVLREAWKAQPVGPAAEPNRRRRFAENHPLLGSDIDMRLIWAALTLMAIGSIAIFVHHTHSAGMFAVAAVFLMIGVGVLGAWLAGL